VLFEHTRFEQETALKGAEYGWNMTASCRNARAAKELSMNVVLWVLQVALALLYLAGGAYKTFSFDEVAKQMTALPRGGWAALGVVEMLGATLLIVPAAAKWMPVLTPLAAAVLALETLALAAVYARYSLEVAVTNPLVWAVVMALLAAFTAYGRYAFGPSSA
jgi:hypothetical protein